MSSASSLSQLHLNPRVLHWVSDHLRSDSTDKGLGALAESSGCLIHWTSLWLRTMAPEWNPKAFCPCLEGKEKCQNPLLRIWYPIVLELGQPQANQEALVTLLRGVHMPSSSAPSKGTISL